MIHYLFCAPCYTLCEKHVTNNSHNSLTWSDTSIVLCVLKVDLCFHGIVLHNTCSLPQHIHELYVPEAVLEMTKQKKQMTLQARHMSKTLESLMWCIFIEIHQAACSFLVKYTFQWKIFWDYTGVQKKEGGKMNCYSGDIKNTWRVISCSWALILQVSAIQVSAPYLSPKACRDRL